jgi:RNA-binding protein Luc7-like 2
LEGEIKRLLQQAEYLGDAGKIEESERVNEEVQNLRRAKEDLTTLAENPTMVAKQMKVCEVCGAMQATNDTEKRNQTHLEGKVHTGFLKLRAELAKLERRKEVSKLHMTTQRAIRKEEVKAKAVEKSHRNDARKRSSSREDRRENGERDDKRKEKERRRSKERRSREKHRERSREKSKKKLGDHSKEREESRDDRKKHKKDKKQKRSRS